MEHIYLYLMFVQTAVFVGAWSLTRAYVQKHGSIPGARTMVKVNNWIYAAASLGLLCLITSSSHEPVARLLYHFSKFYEYIDVLGVLATGGSVDLHFGFHHLTTPYLTFFRVLQNYEGWRLVGTLNSFHHALMYAYFGGFQTVRPALFVTGGAQLILGIVGECWKIQRKVHGIDLTETIWPNVFSLALLCSYFVLWSRETYLHSRKKSTAEQIPHINKEGKDI